MITRVLFVCHGNICRSPMAEYIFKKLVKDDGLESSFFIDSAATSYEEIGNDIYPPAKRELIKNKVDFSLHSAKRVKPGDYDKFDYFIVMDDMNYRNLKNIFNGKEDKIHKLTAFSGSGEDIFDPWYSGDFKRAYDEIYNGCQCFLRYLKTMNK